MVRELFVAIISCYHKIFVKYHDLHKYILFKIYLIITIGNFQVFTIHKVKLYLCRITFGIFITLFKNNFLFNVIH